MARDGKYLVVYDIENNRERSRVSKVLAGFGRRIQKSVFECRLTRSSRNKLLGRLEALDVRTGCILCYRVNDNARRDQVGRCDDVPEDESYAYIA